MRRATGFISAALFTFVVTGYGQKEYVMSGMLFEEYTGSTVSKLAIKTDR